MALRSTGLAILSTAGLIVLTQPARVWCQDVDVVAQEVIEAPSAKKTDTEEESTVFDVYVGPRFRGATIISYTDSWFEVEDPADVVSQLPDIEKQARDKLIELLTGRIERERQLEGVGRVSYDLNTFRLVIEPAPQLMKGSELDVARKLGDPESGFSLQQSFGVAAVGQQDGSNTSSFSHRSLASLGNGFARLDGVAIQNRPYRINQATVGALVDEYQARGGYLQMRAQPLVSSLRFAGLQLDTAEELFLNDELSRGSKLELFVPSRSTVQFYRDGQLLSVQVLDYGLQEINTSEFPQGSYDVDIIIVDSSGRETRERRFYTKAGFLTARSQPTFSLSAGLVRDQVSLDVYNTPLFQGVTRWRAIDIMDLGLSAATTDTNSVGNLGVDGLYRGVRFGASVGASPNGDRGYTGSLGFTLFGFGLSGRFVESDGQNTSMATPTPTPATPSYIPDDTNPNRDIIIQTQSLRSAGVSRSFGSVSVRYDLQSNKLEQDKRRFSQGVTTTWRIFDRAGQNLSTSGSILDTDLGRLKSIQLGYRYRLSSQWSLNSQLLRRWQSTNSEILAVVGFQYDSTQAGSSQGARLTATTEARRLSGANSLTGGLLGDSTGEYMRTQGFARGGIQSDSNVMVAGINAQSSVIVSNKGDVAVVHPPQSESVFVAQVVGNAVDSDDEFEVVVDDQVKDVVRAGERGIVNLSPYRKYRVSVRPKEGGGLVSYDATEYTFTAFPGNVIKREWSFDKIFIALGRLLDEDGKPIVRERIKGPKEYVFTEDDGTFQAEVTGKERLYVDSKRVQCDLDITFDTIPEYVLDLHDVVCRRRGSRAGTEETGAKPIPSKEDES